MIAASVWQTLLEGFGYVLAFLFDVVRNYGLAIILLTVLVRVLLLPLTIKQTRSMQQMQLVQPLIKEIQRKHKGNRQKMNEELMKVYKEHRVNPLGGCLPLVMQLPVFFALYATLRGDAAKALERFKGIFTDPLPSVAHLPIGSRLAGSIQEGHSRFLGMNLACSPSSAGRGPLQVAKGVSIDCGATWSVAIPFFVLVALMVFTTWYQQRQMQAMSGQVNPQMQIMGKIMPVFLGFISLNIPAGVLLYWVTTNLWQVGQQQVMFRKGMVGASANGGRPTGASRGDGKAPPGKALGKPQGKGDPGTGSRKGVPGAGVKKAAPGRGGAGRDGGGSRKKRRKR